MAADRNLVIVGANGRAVNGANDQGVAYVYNCTSSPLACTLGTSLTPFDGHASNFFGSVNTIAIVDSLVAVGSWGYHAYNGSVYLYTCTSSTSCSAGTRIDPPVLNPEIPGAYFGSAVAMSPSVSGESTILVVGAYNGNVRRGAIYVYSCVSETSCSSGTPLMLPDAADNDYFGREVVVSGSLVAATALGRSTWKGAVFTFQCTTTPGSPLVAPSCSGPYTLDPGVALADYDQFGTSLTARGDILIATMPARQVNGRANQGAAVAFHCPTASSCVPGALFSSVDGERFGYQAAFSRFSNTVLVSAPVTLSNLGTAHIVSCQGSNCTVGSTIYPSGGNSGDQFGSSLAMTLDGLAVVGAQYRPDGIVTNAGAAYAINGVCSTRQYGAQCTACSPGCIGCDDGFSGSDTGNCASCSTGYAGVQCNDCDTNFVPVGSGVCDCPSDRYGAECELSCPSCGHGACSSGVAGNGTCICDAGWVFNEVSEMCSDCAANYFGSSCSVCDTCNGHGQCRDGAAGNGTCACEAGYDAVLRCAQCLEHHVEIGGNCVQCHASCSSCSNSGSSDCTACYAPLLLDGSTCVHARRASMTEGAGLVPRAIPRVPLARARHHANHATRPFCCSAIRALLRARLTTMRWVGRALPALAIAPHARHRPSARHASRRCCLMALLASQPVLLASTRRTTPCAPLVIRPVPRARARHRASHVRRRSCCSAIHVSLLAPATITRPPAHALRARVIAPHVRHRQRVLHASHPCCLMALLAYLPVLPASLSKTPFAPLAMRHAPRARAPLRASRAARPSF